MGKKTTVAKTSEKASEKCGLIERIIGSEKDPPKAERLNDALEMVRLLESEGAERIMTRTGQYDYTEYNTANFKAARKYSLEIRRIATKAVKEEGNADMLDIVRRTLLFDAPHNFDCYCRYLEWNRDPRNKFYEPRRAQLLPVVQALQELEDDELDIVGIMMPPGVGKTTLGEFFSTWIGGRHPQFSTLVGSHSSSLVSGMYGEMLRIINGNGGEYLWSDIFPDVKLVSTNSVNLRIDLGRAKRFETLEFTGIDSRNAGKVRASNLLYCDDLVDGIETAMNKERLAKLWQKYYTDLRQRKIGSCKELHIATPWSLYDPMNKLRAMNENNKRAKFLRLPALNDKGESNFDYPYNLGYTTKVLHEQKDIMDAASWEALFMCNPIEREGLLYEKDEFRRYFELPEREPDAILAVCDTKNKGDDYCVMPVAYKYGNDYYIDRIVCNNGKPEVVDRKIADALIQCKVDAARFESNNAGGRIAENIQKMVSEAGGKTKITTKWNNSNKDTRIVVASPWVKEHCLFKDESKYDKEYRSAMDFLTSYSMAGRMKHDDVPDAMAQLYDFVYSMQINVATVVSRPF